MLAARTPLQINKTEGHLTHKPEETRPVCLTDLACCTGELSETKASLCMEPAWDTSVFIRLIEHKITSRALNKSREWRSSMQTKWHMRPSWMWLTFQWKTFSFHSNTSQRTSLTWLPANTSHLQKNIPSSDVSRLGPDKCQSQHFSFFLLTLQVSLHKSHHCISSVPLSRENKT